MATAAAAGSLLASAGSAAAGAGAFGGTVAGLSAGTFAAGLGAASTALAGLSRFQAQEQRADALEQASEQRADELEFQIQQEKTQSAVEEAQRQRKLRRTLAAQRAAFGAGGASETSGSPIAIQRDTQNISRRQQGRSDLQSDLEINQINQQIGQKRRSGQIRANAERRKGRTSLLSSASTVGNQINEINRLST